MKQILFIIISVLFISCGQEKRPLAGATEFQRELNAVYKDASTSPLKDKDRKNFRGLDFFKFDSAYVVKADLKRTPDETPFKMKTNTNRLAEYIKYGELRFQLNGALQQLNIYQSLEKIDGTMVDQQLFLPFLDETNGQDSYGGGRYIDVPIPKGDTIIIDFNQAFNPYCAYNEKYSCPIVPRENYLDLPIEAGVKAFAKHE